MSGAIVHFSGGSDSTLCAALLAERHERVHLLTYDRASFIGAADYTLDNHRRLCRIYGEDRFVRHVVNIEHLHRAICFSGYPRIARRFGLAVVALTFSKLAMHWFSMAYALRHGIKTVADGAVPYMDLYPDQNERICLTPLRERYRALGIRYENPVFALAESVEGILYDKGLSDSPLIRGTEQDRQVFYAEQVILAMFMKYYITTHGRARYEERLSELFRDRMEMMATGLHGPLLEQALERASRHGH